MSHANIPFGPARLIYTILTSPGYTSLQKGLNALLGAVFVHQGCTKRMGAAGYTIYIAILLVLIKAMLIVPNCPICSASPKGHIGLGVFL